MFKKGRDLNTSERAWLGASGRQGVALGELRSLRESEDVYCCVKTYMCDTSLQQALVLVLPGGCHERLVDEPRKVCARHPMGKPKIDNYTKLEAKLRDYGMQRAADALHALMHDRTYSLPAPRWLRSG